jgi:hypothetical protein
MKCLHLAPPFSSHKMSSYHCQFEFHVLEYYLAVTVHLNIQLTKTVEKKWCGAYIYWVLGEIIVVHQLKLLSIAIYYFVSTLYMYSNWNYQNLPSKMCRIEQIPIMISPYPIFEVNKLPHNIQLTKTVEKKWCGSIYLLSFGGNYSCAPSQIPRLE